MQAASHIVLTGVSQGMTSNAQGNLGTQGAPGPAAAPSSALTPHAVSAADQLQLAAGPIQTDIAPSLSALTQELLRSKHQLERVGLCLLSPLNPAIECRDIVSCYEVCIVNATCQ